MLNDVILCLELICSAMKRWSMGGWLIDHEALLDWKGFRLLLWMPSSVLLGLCVSLFLIGQGRGWGVPDCLTEDFWSSVQIQLFFIRARIKFNSAAFLFRSSFFMMTAFLKMPSQIRGRRAAVSKVGDHPCSFKCYRKMNCVTNELLLEP